MASTSPTTSTAEEVMAGTTAETGIYTGTRVPTVQATEEIPPTTASESTHSPGPAPIISTSLSSAQSRAPSLLSIPPFETTVINDPPAYSRDAPSEPPSSPRPPSPPPPPLPPSPVITPIRTLPATRPASFPLLNLSIPSSTPRPYTFHQPPTSTVTPTSHALAINIFPDPDSDLPTHEEPLPTYSRYPKRGEAHCMGELGDPDARSELSQETENQGRRRPQKKICCCGLYMRTVIFGIVFLIVACVIAGGVVGWQMKSNFENVPDSGPDSTPLGGSGNGGDVGYWDPPSPGSGSSPNQSNTPTATSSRLIVTVTMPSATHT